MSFWAAVHGINDGDNNDAATFNRPITELIQRTDYLNEQLQALYGAGEFAALRISDVPVVANTPVGTVVYRNPDSGTFEPAVASMLLEDNFTVGDSSFAIGVLVQITGALGKIVLAGACPLITGVIPWTVSSLVETGETFRAGPYYLSSFEAGRITANPSGPRIYIGNYDTDYAILSPQYRDTGEAHVHRTYALYSQPAGTQEVTNPDQPDGTHAIQGFTPVTPGGVDRQPRLVVEGTWAADPTTYTIILGADSDKNTIPAGFNDAMLYWSSSDILEGEGSIRVVGFDIPVVIGTKGLVASLENPTTDQWTVPYAVGGGTDTLARRTWTIAAPDAVRGWKARKVRKLLTRTPDTADNGYMFQLHGGPIQYADTRLADTVTIVCPGYACDLPMAANPNAGDTTVVGASTFEYTADGTVTVPTYIPVLIDTDVLVTVKNLKDAILDLADATLTPVIAADGLSLTLGTTESSVTHIGAAIAGTATVGDVGSTAKLLVHDRYNVTLVTPVLWTPSFTAQAVLANGLDILGIAYNEAGTYRTSVAMASGSTWSVDIVDEAPGAHFEYAVGMHQPMAQFYPPIPVTSAAFVLNGVELDPQNLFADDPTYKLGTSSIYWYSNAYGMVPWPADWTAWNQVYSPNLKQNAVLHFIRNANTTGGVTSLQPAPGSPLLVRRCGTADAATVGDLEIDIDLSKLTQGGTPATTGVQQILAGPGIYVDKPTGIVTVSLASESTYSGDFDSVALLNAKEEVVGMFPYIKLLPWRTGSSNIPSGFVCKFRVPHNLTNIRYYAKVYATVFGESDVAAGTPLSAGLTFSYTFLPDLIEVMPGDSFKNLRDPYASPIKNVLVPFGGVTAYTAFDPLLLHDDVNIPDVANQTVNGGFGVIPAVNDFNGTVPGQPILDTGLLCLRPGTIVGIKIQRASPGTASEYTGALGFLNLRWQLDAIQE